MLRRTTYLLNTCTDLKVKVNVESAAAFCLPAMARCYFLCYFIFTSCLAAGRTPQYRLKGQEAKVTPLIPAQPEYILWKHDGDKVVQFDGSEQKEYKSYKNRITLDWHSAELTIKDLQHDDSGEYELEAVINRKLHNSNHKVIVIDEVEKPNISCVMNDDSSSNKYETWATLCCSSKLRGHPSLMEFDWEALGKVQRGPVLNISLQGRSDESVYVCTVSTPLSKKTASFTAKDCYQDEIPVALIAAIVSCILLILIICVGLGYYCYRRRQKVPAHIEEGDTKKGIMKRNEPESDGELEVPAEDEGFLLRTNEQRSTTPEQPGKFAEILAFFEKGQTPNHPVRNQTSKNRAQKKETHQHEEERSPIDNKATLPSPQRLRGMSQTHPDTESEDPACNHKEDADSNQVIVPATEQKLPDSDSPGIMKRNEPESDGELEVSAEDEQSELQWSTTPKEPGSERKADEDEETASAPASIQPHSPLTQNDPSMDPEEASSEQKEDNDSEPPTEKPTEKSLSELHSSDVDKINESDNSNEDQQKEDPDSDQATIPPAEENVPDSDSSGFMEKNKLR
ncbi:hypothetical protein LDENG_00073510 [Lucifuga dentata]|nr:hypothetical protein LDENG_00073510 [Lucifuga dentata]